MWYIIKNVALYKPISFVAEFYYMSNGLTFKMLIETSHNFQGNEMEWIGL